MKNTDFQQYLLPFSFTLDIFKFNTILIKIGDDRKTLVSYKFKVQVILKRLGLFRTDKINVTFSVSIISTCYGIALNFAKKTIHRRVTVHI